MPTARRKTKSDLDAVFRPRSIAVIGASRRANSIVDARIRLAGADGG